MSELVKAPVSDGLSVSEVREVVDAVLGWEHAASTDVSVSFLPEERMRALNRRDRGSDRPTDVLAYRLPHAESLVGDVYVCPAVAKLSAEAAGIDVHEELIRLVIHGTLHVLGWDHPDDASRVQSPMWSRQEQYVRRLATPTR